VQNKTNAERKKKRRERGEGRKKRDREKENIAQIDTYFPQVTV
jgi:hypothetical protein